MWIKIDENLIPKNSIGGWNWFGEIEHATSPPDKEHTYIFKLYALDTILDSGRGSTKTDVETSIQSHVILKHN